MALLTIRVIQNRLSEPQRTFIITLWTDSAYIVRGYKLLSLDNIYVFEENEKLLKELFPLYELTKKYGSPDKWQQMIHTALKIKYAVRASQSKGDQETVNEIIRILKIIGGGGVC